MRVHEITREGLGSKVLGAIGNVAKKIGIGAEKELPRVEPTIGTPVPKPTTNTVPALADNTAKSQSQSLSSMVSQDQAERNAYKAWVEAQLGGDYTKGGEMWAKLKNRPRNDIFGDAVRQDQFMKMKFDFDKFTTQAWNDYWLMAQHCDNNRDFQKNALSIIEKYLGTDHNHYKFLYDRISKALTGKQKYGTQNGLGYTGEFNSIPR
jgi:hypothetical protein